MPYKTLQTQASKFLYSNDLCFSTYMFAGGVGSFFIDTGLKIIMTLISLLIASRFVQRYKDWIEANSMDVSELSRLYLFLKAGVLKLKNKYLK